MSHRVDKVNHSMQRELGVLITNDLRDPRLGFVTVVSVKCSKDLKYAKVFVSVMGDDKQKKSTLIALESAKGFLRSRIGALMELRIVPHLSFVIDESLDHSLSFNKLLNEVHESEAAKTQEVYDDQIDSESDQT